VAVERLASIVIDDAAARVLRGLDERLNPERGPLFDAVARRAGAGYALDPARLLVRRGTIEDLDLGEPVDLVYSNDVMEHVDDPGAVYRAAHRLLRPGGRFVSNVDLSGHNAFSSMERPLDFLTCDDRLWRLMFSNVTTTNRVRFHEHLDAARAAGFDVSEVKVVRRADPAYLAALRPHLLPRYRDLPDDDLGVVQCVIVAVIARPAGRARRSPALGPTAALWYALGMSRIHATSWEVDEVDPWETGATLRAKPVVRCVAPRWHEEEEGVWHATIGLWAVRVTRGLRPPSPWEWSAFAQVTPRALRCTGFPDREAAQRDAEASIAGE
jgi:SAM-dependent methyltransferase